MKKQFLLFTALLCATTIVANDTEYPQMDTVFVEGDTILFPHYPEPIHLDLSAAHKASLAETCMQDSLVGLDEKGNYVSKTEYEYDNAGHIISETKYKWVNGVKTGISRYWKKYTGSTATTTVNYQWNTTINDWTGKDSTQLLYYDNGKDKGTAVYTGSNGKWLKSKLLEYEYDANCGKETLTRNSIGDASGENWVYKDMRGHTYDEKGRVIVDSAMVYVDGEWVGTGKSMVVTRYDENGNVALTETYQGWENGKWKGKANGRTANKYNSNKQLIEKIVSTWKNGAWEEYQKTTTDYEGSNVRDNAVYNWNNGWISYSRTSTTWTDGKKTEELVWKPNGGDTWIENTKVKYGYTGGNISMQEPLKKDGENWIGNGTKWTKTFVFTNKLETQTNYRWGSAGWVESTKDSTKWINSSLSESTSSYKWDNSKWVGIKKTRNTYNTANKPLSTETLAWGGTEDNWRDSLHTIYEYNESNIETLKVNAKKVGDEWQAIDSTKREISSIVDGKQKVDLDLTYKWTSKTGLWTITGSKNKLIYDDGGNTIERVTSNFSNGAWVYKDSVLYAFKDNKNTYKTLDETWSYNTTSHIWKGNHRYEFKYDDKYRIISSTYYNEWNTERGAWRGDEKTEQIYNESGEVVSGRWYNWDKNLWTWVGYVRIDYNSRDAFGNIEEQISWEYDLEKKDWVQSELERNKYNASGDLIRSDIYKNFIEEDDEYWCHKSRTEKSFDETGEGRLRYNLNITYSSSECDVITLYDMQRYYYSCDNYYTIHFLDWDNTELESQQVLEGYKPFDDNIRPTRQDDAQYTYEFNGWDKEIAVATANAVYTAVYTQTTKQYTVIFKDEAGNEWQKSKFDYGTEPVYTNMTPTKEGDAQFTYSFAGWGEGLLPVHGDTAYIAKFDVAVNKYDITFSYGEQSHIETLEYGALIATEWVPELINTAEFEYSFVGWKELAQGATVAGTASYEADVTATKRSYDITFVVGEENYSTSLQYGTSYATILAFVMEEFGIVENEGKYQFEDADFIYTFIGWEEVEALPETVTESATYTMRFSKEAKVPTGVESVENEAATVKVYENGVLYILRNGKKFTTTGSVVE